MKARSTIVCCGLLTSTGKEFVSTSSSACNTIIYNQIYNSLVFLFKQCEMFEFSWGLLHRMKKKLIAITLSVACMTSLASTALASPSIDPSLVITKRQADVNNDQMMDTIYLIGRTNSSTFTQDIDLQVMDGRTKQLMDAKLLGCDGYAPAIEHIGDYNGDHASDIVITAYSDADHNLMNTYIVSFAANTPEIILNKGLINNNQLTRFHELEYGDYDKDGVYELVGVSDLPTSGSGTVIRPRYASFNIDYQNDAFTVTKEEQYSYNPLHPNEVLSPIATNTDQPSVIDGEAKTQQALVQDKKDADINRDGISDHIYLIGNPEQPNAKRIKDINVIVVDGKTHKNMKTNLLHYSGYNPYVSFTGDFNGDRAQDIMITAYDNTNYNTTNVKIISYYNNVPKVIFEEQASASAKYNTIDPVDTNLDHVYELLGTRSATKPNTGFMNSYLSYKSQQHQFQTVQQAATRLNKNEQHISPTKDFTYTIPAAWDDQVWVDKLDSTKLNELNMPGVYMERIVYAPRFEAKKKLSAVVARVSKYTKTEWNEFVRKGARGTVVGTKNDKIYIVEVAQYNPFESGSKDAEAFQNLLSYIKTFINSVKVL